MASCTPGSGWPNDASGRLTPSTWSASPRGPAPGPPSYPAGSGNAWPSRGALAGQPDIVLADEPTGNLDQATGQSILALLETLHDGGVTILIITHDQGIAGRMPRRIEMLDGRIVADTTQAPPPPTAAEPGPGGGRPARRPLAWRASPAPEQP